MHAPCLPVLAGALLVLGVMQSLREEPAGFSLLPAEMPPVCGLVYADAGDVWAVRTAASSSRRPWLPCPSPYKL